MKAGVKRSPVSQTEGAMAPGLRRYVHLTAAVSGGAIMVVEILGAKMLAPFVGTSHFVWTAQIAVTLVALAAGYYWGGRQADRVQRLGWLYGALLVAAVYLCLVTLVLRPVANACLDLPLAAGSFLASAALFFVPLSLMAMTTPFLIRFVTASVSTVGGSVGRLSAVSTVGSFLGTLLIGYLLIPYFRNSVTMLLTAGVLMVMAVIYLLVWGRGGGVGKAAGLVVVGSLLGVAALRGEKVSRHEEMVELFRRNSNFGELMVWEHKTGSPRYYLNDLLVQNIYDPRTRTGLAQFTYMLHGLARAYTPEIRDVLCIGLGVGLVPAQFAAEGARVEVFEINPDVAEVAREYFDCPLNTFQLRVGDGRQLLNQATNRYDSVILDAFLGDSSPGHLMSVEAFESIRGVLRPEGTLVINCFAEFGPGKDFYGASLDKTLRAVFPFVKIHATGSGNVYFVASMRAGAEVLRQPDYASMNSVVGPRIRQEFMATLRANPESGIVLTDDYNPVEVFDAPQREETRKRLARTMQSL
jgi:SAM-dependent methyltransferase